MKHTHRSAIIPIIGPPRGPQRVLKETDLQNDFPLVPSLPSLIARPFCPRSPMGSRQTWRTCVDGSGWLLLLYRSNTLTILSSAG